MRKDTVDPDQVESDSFFGAPVNRQEDRQLLMGEAEYTDDIDHPHSLHMAVVRSLYGHARIEGVDTSEAEAVDGVEAVLTAEDLAASDVLGVMDIWVIDDEAGTYPDRPILAEDRVRYQGEPIAVVVADDQYTAANAADQVDVSYERLDAVTEPAEAVESDVTLHEEAPDNVALDWSCGDEDATAAAFEDADTVVEIELENNRLIPSAMEPRAAIANYRPSTGELKVEMTSQNPHLHKMWLSNTLDHPEHKIQVDVPDMGGGFGGKIHHYPEEALAAWSSMEVERPVKWQATRSEDFSSTIHGREHDAHAELALDADGTIRAVRTETYVGVGGYLSSAETTVGTDHYAELLSGQYDIPVMYGHVIGTFINTTPVDAYRGAGRPEACYVIERLMSKAARELGMDPVELRRKNLVPTDKFPDYEAPSGLVYDSGDYEKALDVALDQVDYEQFRERQAEAREEGRYLGLGIANYVEDTGAGTGLFESGQVQITSSGSAIVRTGTHSHGQGHRTSFAQIVADELGIPYEDIEVVEGDTDATPEGHGTWGSRTAAAAGTAIKRSASSLRDKARQIAADQLEADPDDLTFAEGEFHVSGAPSRSISIQAIAELAYGVAGDLPEDVDLGLDETTFHEPPGGAFPFGTHLAIVEVDPQSGEIEIEKYVAVDDVGTQINPKIVEGQVHGGVAQGLGQALYEGAQFDESGNLLTGTLQDYAMPKAHHIPEMQTESTVTESPKNPLGVKGVGEVGTVAAPPTMVNAVVDALEPFDVDHLDMPLKK